MSTKAINTYSIITPKTWGQTSSLAQTSTIPIGGNATMLEGYNDRVQAQSHNNLTREEQIKLNNIYKRIAEICEEHNISLKLAKSEHLLERIAGCQTSKEFLQLSENKINEIIAILDDSLGWGDGLGFGEKDKADLNKLVEKIHEKMNLQAVDGSKLGRIWHDIKSAGKNAFGLDSVDKCTTPAKISDYYKRNYLDGIKTAENKEEMYAELLKAFFYDFDRTKDPQKQMAMIKAIENLAANDREIIIEVIERCYSQDKEKLALLGKALNENFESITCTTDALGNRVTQESATKISHKAFKHMTEEDVKLALETLKADADKFYKEYGEKVEELKAKRERNEELNEWEQELLTQAENAYEGRYAGCITATYVNCNISDNNKQQILANINNDIQEIGIHEEVFKGVNKFVQEQPEVVGNREDFEETLNAVTNNKYAECINNNMNVENNNDNCDRNCNDKNDSNDNNSNTVVDNTDKIEQETISTVAHKDKNYASIQNNNTTTSTKTYNSNSKVNTQTYQASQEKPLTASVQTPMLLSEDKIETEKENEETSNKKVADIVKVSNKKHEDFIKYVEEKGTVKSIIEIYNNISNITNQSVLDWANKHYSILNANTQENILQNLKTTKGFSELLAETSDKTVLGLKSNFINHYTMQLVEEAQQKAKEKQANNNFE